MGHLTSKLILSLIVPETPQLHQPMFTYQLLNHVTNGDLHKHLNRKSQKQLRNPNNFEEQSLMNSSEHAKLIKAAFCT